MKTYIVENEYLKVEVCEKGGSMTSIFDKNKHQELLYQPLENSWKGQDIVIFPFVGRLKNKTYTVNNKEYSLECHGLIRYDIIQLYKQTENKIVLRYRYTKETLNKYPFMFDFYVTYELINRSIKISYQIVNLGNQTMYFGLGAHPAFMCDGVTNEEFKYNNTFITYDGYIFNRYDVNKENGLIKQKIAYNMEDKLFITKDLFKKYDTLVLESSMVSTVTLHNKNSKITLELDKTKALAIWSDQKFGNYVCIEPWWSIPDFENSKKELKDKPLLNILDSNQIFESYYKIYIE